MRKSPFQRQVITSAKRNVNAQDDALINIGDSNSVAQNMQDVVLSDDTESEDDNIDNVEEEGNTSDEGNSEAYYDYGKYNNLQCDPTIMFPQSNLSVSDVLLMCRTYWIKFNSTEKERAALLMFIKTLAGTSFENWSVSNYMMARTYDPPKDKITLHFYCKDCNKPLEKLSMADNMGEIPSECKECKRKYKLKSTSPNCIWTIDIEYQIQQLLNQKYIQTALLDNLAKIRQNLDNKNDNVMRDVYDGELYKSIQQKQPGVLTYNFSTDGAPTNPNSSKKSFWPCQMIINELPPKLRFKHILLPALWFTKSEPNFKFMNLYMSYFIDNAKRLSTKGVVIKHWRTGENIIFKFAPLTICADSAARPLMQAHIKYNGYGACSWCHIKGKYASIIRFPFSKQEDALRTHEDNLRDMKAAEKRGSFINGAKGLSELANSLPYFDSIWSYGFEYMHNGTLGIAKQIMEHCTTHSFWKGFDEKQYLGPEQRAAINKKLICIQPTQEIHRLPRPLTENKKWKATEWRSYTIFYYFPCMKGILKEKALKGMLLFSRSLYTLLKQEITEEELNQVEIDILIFVAESQILYGIHAMTFNMHILLHMVQSVRKCGPIWSNSTFPFENGIFICKSIFNGTRNIASELSKKWLRKCSINQCISQFSMSEACTTYCNNILSPTVLTVEQTKTVENGNVLLIGHAKLKDNVVNIIRIILNDENVTPEVFDRCIYMDTRLYSVEYKRSEKRNDSIVLLHSGEIVQITNFAVTGDSCYVLGWSFLTRSINEPVELPYMREVLNTKESRKCFRITNIKEKLLFLQVADKEIYTCRLPNNVEIQ